MTVAELSLCLARFPQDMEVRLESHYGPLSIDSAQRCPGRDRFHKLAMPLSDECIVLERVTSPVLVLKEEWQEFTKLTFVDDREERTPWQHPVITYECYECGGSGKGIGAKEHGGTFAGHCAKCHGFGYTVKRDDLREVPVGMEG